MFREPHTVRRLEAQRFHRSSVIWEIPEEGAPVIRAISVVELPAVKGQSPFELHVYAMPFRRAA